MKFILTALIVYFIYRYFFTRPALDQSGRKIEVTDNKQQAKREDGEYIDYEEID